MDRDFRTEMNQRVDDMQADSDENAVVLADRLLKDLEQNDPDLIEGWLHQQQVVLVRQLFAQRRGSKRGAERTRAGRILSQATSVITNPEATTSERTAASAKIQELSYFKITSQVVNDHGQTRKIGKMNASDCLYVSATCKRTGKRSLLLGTFYQVIAERLGDRMVEDVYSEEEFLRQQATILGESL